MEKCMIVKKGDYKVIIKLNECYDDKIIFNISLLIIDCIKNVEDENITEILKDTIYTKLNIDIEFGTVVSEINL